jgi:LysM repeat protein
MVKYTVLAGDSLSKIAYKSNISLNDLIAANPHIKNPNVIGVGQKINIPVPVPLDSQKTTSSKQFHTVNKGDSLGKIANMYGVTIGDILKHNNIPNPNIIHVGQKIALPENISFENEESDWYKVKNILEGRSQASLDELRALEQSLSDEEAIKASVQTGNYIVVDKKNKKLTVYNKNDRPIYTTADVSFGTSGNDYNTITYVKGNGTIKSGEGNMSTPAGITAISGIGTYHGAPAYTRARVGNNLQIKEGDDIASSIHAGSTKDKNSSNGCVRASKKVLNDLRKYVQVGTKVYTLPEKEGSKFMLRDGHLSFTADDPYGNKIEKSEKEKYWYQYNTVNNREYSPVSISVINPSDDEHSQNMVHAAKVLQDDKKELQQSLNISSQHYNKLAKIALGLLEQETQFGTH